MDDGGPVPHARFDVEQLLGHTGWLRALARGLVCSSDADDLCQDTVLAALTRQPPARVTAAVWLAGIVRRLAAQKRRVETRRARREARAARHEHVPSAAEVVASASLQRQVVDAVLALPAPYRSTVLLRFFEDLPPRRIARAAGVPVETVRTRLKRGLAMVRARLDDERGTRTAWSAPLAVWCGRNISATAAAAGGMLWMGMQSKVMAGVAALLVVACAAWWCGPLAAGAETGAEAAAGTSLPAASDASAKPDPAPPEVRTATASRAPVAAPTRLTVTGVLVDEETLVPIEGGEVTLGCLLAAFTPGGEARTTSARDGTFAVATDDEQAALFPAVWVRARSARSCGRASHPRRLPTVARAPSISAASWSRRARPCAVESSTRAGRRSPALTCSSR